MDMIDAVTDADRAVHEACRVLESGQPVAVPTETVYGLAADIHDESAVRRIFEIKGRPHFNPLICHVSSVEMAQRYVHMNDLALSLAHRFWPGPLTLVLRRRFTGAAAELASASLPSMAVRVPRGFTNNLIEAFGRGLAAPSANVSGRVSPTCADHVRLSLGDKVKLIVDGGACCVGLESTVIGVSEDGVCTLLRPGGLDADVIERFAGITLMKPSSDETLKSPGMMSSHYAPRAQVRLGAHRVHVGEALIKFGPRRVTGEEQAILVINLTSRGDLDEAAAALFDALVVADRSGAKTIAIAPIPTHGLGFAINDRLRRAAAPRSI